MILNDVHRGIHKNKKRKRLGRGIGSGHGKTCGRGHKGDGSRNGARNARTFIGGAMPLVMRTPKRGFNNKWGKTVAVVNIGDINDAFNPGEEVTVEALKAKNLAKGRFDLLKILGEGDVTKKLTVSAHLFSESAKQKIEAAGGKITVTPQSIPVAEKQAAAKAIKVAAKAAAKAAAN
jgi:large subunit ribosomal protein L15